MTEWVARRIVTALLERITIGELTVHEGATRRVYGRGTPRATVTIHSPAAWSALARGGRGFGESYVSRLWDTDDLTAVVEIAARNIGGIDELRRRLQPASGIFQRLRSLSVSNTPVRSRADIAAHYDLGNDMFELMLDETMMYSCALFERPEMTLAEASRAKLDRICTKLELGPLDHVLEIGTGWGGFAIHAAATRGCRVTTTTISREQREHAQARVDAAGLGDRITILGEDYRHLRGSFDKLVSLEMIEAVGWKDFGTYFGTCARLLRPHGAMALQAITIDDRLYEVDKASRTFIRDWIFPNGCLPSVEVIARAVSRHGDLRVIDLEDITEHYPETLRRWRRNVEDNSARLSELGYDEHFQRLWRFYLCYCEAGFMARRIGDVQVVLAKPRWNGTIETREAELSLAG